MIHILLLVFGVYWVGVGITICVMLVRASLKANKGLLLITIPGLLVMGVLTINFVCHMLHLPNEVMPHQKQIVNAINVGLQIMIVPVMLLKLYELWAKRRAQASHRPKDASPSE